MTYEEAMVLAERHALFSLDPFTKVGAVVLNERREMVTTGWNEFPQGIREDSRLLDRPLKNRIILHAEETALLRAHGKGRIMFLTMPSCDRCARLVIASGIRELVYGENYEWEGRFFDSVIFGIDLMLEAGINVHSIGKKEPWVLGSPYKP